MAADGTQGGGQGEQAPVKAVDLLVAPALLTRLPIPLNPARASGRMAPAVWVYPLVGAVLGAGVAAVSLGLVAVGAPVPLAAVIAIAAGVLATGAMHEDGLADCADGIGGGWSRERRLEIMKDSATGAYGALALIFAVLARVAALSMLIAYATPTVFAALMVAGAASRAPLGAMMRWLPNARAAQGAEQAGLSASVGRPPAASAGLALGLGLVIAAAFFGWLGLVAALAAFLAAGAMAWIAWRKLGGQTGDVLGAAQVLAEVAALTAVFIAG
jgi:adenosylcobinamide-GDP ribazoletransferase